jgi:predicted helicase
LKRELPRIPFIGAAAVPPVQSSKFKVQSSKFAPSATFFPLAAIEKMQGDAKPGHNPKASAKLFHAFAPAGQKLADLHLNYESAKEFPLKRQENKDAKLNWRVESMKLTKDKSSLFYNDFLTLHGIPRETYDYRLGNRSALEWVIDQYRVTRDPQGNITSDPNRLDDEQYILRLIAQVTTVSLETMTLVKSLPAVQFE